MSCSLGPRTARLAGAAAAIILLSTTPPAIAAAADGHYVGHVQCQDRLSITLTVAGKSALLSYRDAELQEPTETFKGTHRSSGGAVAFVSDTDTERLKGTLNAATGEIKGEWFAANGERDENCGPVSLARVRLEPAAHADRLLSLYAEKSPSLEQAEEVAALAISRPDLVSLPELRRASLLAKLDAARSTYWRRFWAGEQARLLAMPSGSPDALKGIEQRIARASAPGMGEGYVTVSVPMMFSDGDFRDGGSFVRWAATLLADRRAALGIAPMPLSFGGERAACERLHSGRHAVGIESVEMLFALPVDYWDPALIEDMRASLERCHPTVAEVFKSRYTDIVTILDGETKEIEKRVAGRRWLLAEVARQKALPATIANLRATGNFTLSRDATGERDITQRQVERLFEPAMTAHRAAAIPAARAEIDTAFAAAVPGTESEGRAGALCDNGHELPREINAHCSTAARSFQAAVVARFVAAQLEQVRLAPRTLAGLKATAGYRLDRRMLPRSRYELSGLLTAAEPGFNNAVEPLLKEAVANGVKEIQAAFAVARPDTASAETARSACADAHALRYPVLIEACITANQVYRQRYAR